MSATDLTVVYYTAHLEEPAFEARVRERLAWASAGLPIVSVSQRPLDFGRNICVGEHPPCMWNCRRQMLIGVEAVKTDWLVFCEADTLYPPEFFLRPERPARQFVRYTPGAIVYMSTHRAWFKYSFETGILIAREHAREILGANLRDLPTWGTRDRDMGLLFTKGKMAPYAVGEWPIVSFKTGRGMHRFSHADKNNLIQTLTGWGDVKALKQALFAPMTQEEPRA